MADNLNELVNEVLKHADIVDVISSYLTVTKKGREYVALCPFHDDTSPSLKISKEKQVFKCFVDGTGGNAIRFVQEYEHISFFEALRKVAKIVNFDDPRLHQQGVSNKPIDAHRETLIKCTNDLTTYYEYAVNTAEGKEGLEYFESRHLDASMRKKYRLGYSFKNGQTTCLYLQSKGHSLKTIEDIGIATISNSVATDRNQGRVIFPIADEEGDIIGYSARRLGNGDEAKYINSPETYLFHKSSVLYNYHIAKEKARVAGYVYVLEGFMDVFALARIGIDSAVAIMGTSLTKEHIAMLRKLNVEIRLCLDGDLPGQTATIKIARALSEAGLRFRIVDNRGSSKDPDEILNEDGEDALKYYLNNLVDRVDFALNYYRRTNPLKTIEEKKVLIREFIPILASIQSQLELDSYLRKLADITSFEAESIRDLVKNSRKVTQYDKVDVVMKDFRPERKVLKRLLLVEREILYLMMQNEEAVDFYETNIGTFYDSMYRQIANFAIESYRANEFIDPMSLIATIQASGIENANELIDEVSEIAFEKNHRNVCSRDILETLKKEIEIEKDEIHEKDCLEESLKDKDKDPLSQARILAEYNRRKVKKKETEEEDK